MAAIDWSCAQVASCASNVRQQSSASEGECLWQLALLQVESCSIDEKLERSTIEMRQGLSQQGAPPRLLRDLTVGVEELVGPAPGGKM